MLPNLLIIGAAKSGTTSLHDYLDQHPAVHMARPRSHPARGQLTNDRLPKEMRFWWRDDWRDRMRWYESHFDVPHAIRGEATPAYSAHPYHAGVPERIYEFVPETKLIYLVRDPIARLVAHWVQRRADGHRRPLGEILRDPGFENDPIVCASMYATQLECYLAHFSLEQILVVDQHDLRHRRREALREIFGFLGIEPDFWSPRFEEERNTREEKRAPTRAAPLLTRVADPLAKRIQAHQWERVRPALWRALSRPVRAPEIEPDLRLRLELLLQPEMERLRSLTGREFRSWSL